MAPFLIDSSKMILKALLLQCSDCYKKAHHKKGDVIRVIGGDSFQGLEPESWKFC
jgi:hypothetical protein